MRAQEIHHDRTDRDRHPYRDENPEKPCGYDQVKCTVVFFAVESNVSDHKSHDEDEYVERVRTLVLHCRIRSTVNSKCKKKTVGYKCSVEAGRRIVRATSCRESGR